MTSKAFLFLFPLFLVLYETTVYLSNDMIMPGMIQVVKHFSADDKYIPHALTAVLLGGASLQIFLGPLSDKFGRRLILLAGSFFFFLSAFATIFTQSIEQFMLTRFCQGMGICFIFVVGYTSVQEMFPEKKAIQITSIMATVSIAAPLIGPLLGGLYSQYYAWQGIFVISGVLGLISYLGLYGYMPETVHLKYHPQAKPEKKVDLRFLPPLNIKSILKNYVLVSKNKSFMVGAFCYVLAGVPLMCWISISPILLIEKAKLSSTAYGLYQIPIFGSLMMGNIIVQQIIHKVEIKTIILIGSSIAISGMLLCGLLPLLFGEHYLFIVIPLSFYSLGISLNNAPLMRKVLYSSSQPLGVVSASLSVLGMIVYSTATYSMSFIYASKSNLHYGLFCLAIGILVIPLMRSFLATSE